MDVWYGMHRRERSSLTFTLRTVESTTRSQSDGFALMELILVVTMIAIVVGIVTIAVPSTFESYRLRGATRELFVDLQRARVSAFTENNRYFIAVTDETHYMIVNDENNNNTLDTLTEHVTYRDLTASYQGVRLTTTGTVTFLPTGGLSNTSAITFTLTSANGHMKSVTVSPTGRIRMGN
jgi:Tfp pilus assembly protein FimT